MPRAASCQGLAHGARGKPATTAEPAYNHLRQLRLADVTLQDAGGSRVGRRYSRKLRPRPIAKTRAPPPTSAVSPLARLGERVRRNSRRPAAMRMTPRMAIRSATMLIRQIVRPRQPRAAHASIRRVATPANARDAASRSTRAQDRGAVDRRRSRRCLASGAVRDVRALPRRTGLPAARGIQAARLVHECSRSHRARPARRRSRAASTARCRGTSRARALAGTSRTECRIHHTR
jgi:hypothetical protein